MSKLISKDQLTAYQRWEMTSFNEDSLPNTHHFTKKTEQTELEKIQIQAKTEAYTIGYKEGYEQGFEEGEKAGYAEIQAKQQESISYITQLGHQYALELAKVHHEVGKDLIGLAIDLAHAMTKAHFQFHPEAITDIVNEAIASLPLVHQPAQIFLHPLDAQIVKQHLTQQLEPDGWKIVADHHIERGGCKLETAHNIIDASISTRWNRLTEMLNNESIDSSKPRSS